MDPPLCVPSQHFFLPNSLFLPCRAYVIKWALVTVVGESVKQAVDGGPVLHYSRLLDAAHKGLPRQAAPGELKLLDVVVGLDRHSLIVGFHLTRGHRTDNSQCCKCCALNELQMTKGIYYVQ